VSGDREFSLFARAIEQVASAPDGPSTLADFQVALEHAMREIAEANGKPSQEIRVRTESDRGTFVVVAPGKGSVDQETWRQLASEHPAWQCVPGGDGVAQLHELSERLVTELARPHQRNARSLADDPWHDPSFAKRVSEWVGFLLTKVLEFRTASAAEAALLATAPFVYASY
jgi:hypothetical protein